MSKEIRLAVLGATVPVRETVVSLLEERREMTVMPHWSKLQDQEQEIDFMASCDILIYILHSVEQHNRDVHQLYDLSRLSKRVSKLPIIVYTASDDATVIEDVMHCGVGGVVHASDAAVDLHDAVMAVVYGGRWLSTKIRSALLAKGVQRGNSKNNHKALSKVEYEVIRFFLAGMSVSDIAGVLGKSIKTVSTQKRTVMKKLNAHNDLELAMFSFVQGLV
ncbi:LuxR C-terminal-related transcriptional regulator [Collimonas sp.]|jgi:two-component system capsular synthesis response regulator RcsB|uniref:LuxR C-terminal-related transcriptional regulator n=1 Tax=Collimonas sp. TaxID=1963772 RepID=UPI002CEDF115|nr:LuxR C-terminal-related transcriptional regulator [Collimonas sp.]HWW04840.1 LuxR C-terminal-related transcriptional regulator [Collimonas sp.]